MLPELFRRLRRMAGPAHPPSNRWRCVPVLERLADRVLPTTATFAAGILTVTGDDAGPGADDAIVVSRDLAGTIFVTDGGVPVAIAGGPAMPSRRIRSRSAISA